MGIVVLTEDEVFEPAVLPDDRQCVEFLFPDDIVGLGQRDALICAT